MFVSVSSADKNAEKTFDSFNRMHMIWTDRVLDREHREIRVRSHSLSSKDFNNEDIPISECCRGQNTSMYI